MGYDVHYLKTGMAGSKNGRSRTDPTSILKKSSKKVRRRQGKKVCKEQYTSR